MGASDDPSDDEFDWTCERCGSVYPSNPTACDTCGYTVLARHREPWDDTDRRDGSALERTVPHGTCVSCGALSLPDPGECRNCGNPQLDTTRHAAASERRPFDSVSLAVVTAVAIRERDSPRELAPPLHHSIDPDALDALHSSADAARVEFTYLDYRIVIYGDGVVCVLD